MNRVVVAFSAALLLSVIGFAWANNDARMPVIVLFLVLGMLGAALRELQITLKGESVTRKIEYFKERGTVATIARMLLGSILAVALLALCVTGMVGGYLFPEFTFKDAPFVSVKEMMHEGAQFKNNLDAFKAFVWSLIAGYSEDWVLTLLSGAKDNASETDS